jgi:RNA polymerase sigma factor (sigma-70 family)
LTEALARDRRRLIRFVRDRLSNLSESDAEDVVSDVVLRLFEQADLLAQVENVTAYLFRAVGNRLTDLFRRHRPQDELSVEYPDPSPSPEATLEQAQLRRRLDDALAHLSEAERAVWLAVELDDWTFRELAARWNEPMGTLLSRKSRATKSLRKRLAADNPNERTQS